MSDLIDRQKTIEMLEGMKVKDPFDRYEKQNIGLDWAIDAIKAAPAVQTCEDAVSRQAAIDKLDPLFESLAIDKIKALPTAQDVIRCKDCRYQDKGSNESESWNLCGYRPWLHVPTEDEHYCGYAERRTDE